MTLKHRLSTSENLLVSIQEKIKCNHKKHNITPLKIPQQRVEKMARLITVVWCAVAVLLCAAAGASWVEEAANPIRMVAGVEAEVVRVIGQCRRALKFARFMSRFGKSYRSEEEQ